MFIRFTASAFRKLLSVYVISYFPFGFEGRMWDLIVSVPDHCLSVYFSFDPLSDGLIKTSGYTKMCISNSLLRNLNLNLQ